MTFISAKNDFFEFTLSKKNSFLIHVNFIEDFLNEIFHKPLLYIHHSKDMLSFDIKIRLLGGKGGFGSRLRAQGSKMSNSKNSLNISACRDLSGRRIQQIQDDSRIENYVKSSSTMQAARRDNIRNRMRQIIERSQTRKKTIKALTDNHYVADKIELALLDQCINTDSALHDNVRVVYDDEKE